jgi:hypothetical protein
MNLVSGQKLANPNLTYHCPRCGDTYDGATEDDGFQVALHQLLHRAGDWKRSLWPAVNRMTDHQSP